MAGLSPSTINVRLSAVRKMIHEARRNGMLGGEEAADLTDVPNIRQQGTRLGNWLTRKQTKDILAVPDPQMTILMIPKMNNKKDLFYERVLQNNKDVLGRTNAEWIFEYDFSEPASTFAMMASIIGGLAGEYRIVLASLGPKIFGLLCFLLATKYPDLSVWRVSSGVHAEPRDSYPELERSVVRDI